MGDRLMILGASRGQVGLYRACRKLGVESVAASIPGDYPGFDLADHICEVDITNREGVIAAAREWEVDGIATSCMDTGLDVLGAVCETLGFPGLSSESASVCASKLLLKSRLVERAVPTAAYIELQDVEEFDSAAERIGTPIVMKSRLSQGSNGVFITGDLDEARSWVAKVIEREGSCIVERYLDGYEFGAQACVSNGKILFVMPHGDITFQAQSPIPVGHYVPLDAGAKVRQRAVEVSRQAIEALELDDCAVNIDIIFSGGECYILELTGRAGANTLPELVSAHYGIDYYEVIVMLALGREIPPGCFGSAQDGIVLGKMVYVDEDATIGRIDITPTVEGLVDARPFVREGSRVRSFRSLADCIGQIVVVGDTLEECFERTDRQFESMFTIER